MGEKVYSGSGYWATQIIVSLVGGVGLVIIGPVIMVTDEESPGLGLIFFLTGVAFLALLVSLLRSYVKWGKQGRAIYAWAITQQHDMVGTVDPDNMAAGALRRAGKGMSAMSVAAKARDGQLSLDQLRALQALRPEVPYPGTWPSASASPVDQPRRRRSPGRRPRSE